MRVGLPTLFATSAFSLGLLLSTPSLAAPIIGRLDIGSIGPAIVTDIDLDFTCIDSPIAPCTNGDGNVTVSGGTGSFAPLIGEGGYIKDLAQAVAPINEDFLLTDFLTIPALAPEVAFDLRFISVGAGTQANCVLPAAAGQTCTPVFASLVTPNNPLGLSAYTLINLSANSSIVGLEGQGTARNLSTGEISNFVFTFSTQFDVPYQNLLATLAKGGSITNSYSGTANVTFIPEPSTTAFAISGLALLAAASLRRARK